MSVLCVKIGAWNRSEDRARVARNAAAESRQRKGKSCQASDWHSAPRRNEEGGTIVSFLSCLLSVWGICGKGLCVSRVIQWTEFQLSTNDTNWSPFNPSQYPLLICCYPFLPTNHLLIENHRPLIKYASPHLWNQLPDSFHQPSHGCALSYLSDAFKSAPEASRRLCLSGAITCIIPWSRTRLGDRSFDVAGPRHASLWSSDSLCQFRRQLKKNVFVKV